MTAATTRPASTPTVERLLAAAVAAVPHGTVREGQARMAQAVAEAIETGEHLLVQAGTGTGKSLAYLTPALLADGPVVVSTATLALQSQLIEVDLPRLVEAVEPLLGRRPTYAVLKGRHHYVCLARLEPSEEPEGVLELEGGERWLTAAGRMGKQITRIREWALETETGDRDELDPGVDDVVWRAVSMPARECVGAHRCPFGDECFAEASRVRARQVDIVVTNHSLLAMDLMTGRHILPPHQLLIIDEAHELVDRVTSAAQGEVTPDQIDRARRRARTFLDAEHLDRLAEAEDALSLALEELSAGRLETLPSTLREALFAVETACREATHGIGEVRADDPDAVRRQQAKAMLTRLTQVTQRLLSESPQDVIWLERAERGRWAVVVAPLSVAGLLTGGLFSGRTVVAASATLTLGGRFDTIARSLGLSLEYGRTPETGDVRPVQPAATPDPAASDAADAAPAVAADTGSEDRGEYGDAGDLTHLDDPGGEDPTAHGIREWLGTSLVEEPESPPLWRALDVGSPFDYARQGILYVAAHLPRPTQSGLSEAAGEELVQLVTALEGRTLGLFSSRRAAERAAELLRERTDLEVLLQGQDTIPALVRRFKEGPCSCLLGVMSLWQGVDVPGDACQLVVIDRLPFPRPDEPLASARAAAVDAAGGSGFAAVSVPIAAVRLAQGAGRLIRRATDRGVVAVLDPRLHTSRSYGAFLRRSLPPFWYTTDHDVVIGALKRLAAARLS